MLYPNRSRSTEPQARRRLLAIGAAILFAVAAFFAFAGALQAGLGMFFAGMALHAAQPTVLPISTGEAPE